MPILWTIDYQIKHLKEELNFINEASNGERAALGISFVLFYFVFVFVFVFVFIFYILYFIFYILYFVFCIFIFLYFYIFIFLYFYIFIFLYFYIFIFDGKKIFHETQTYQNKCTSQKYTTTSLRVA